MLSNLIGRKLQTHNQQTGPFPTPEHLTTLGILKFAPAFTQKYVEQLVMFVSDLHASTKPLWDCLGIKMVCLFGKILNGLTKSPWKTNIASLALCPKWYLRLLSTQRVKDISEATSEKDWRIYRGGETETI